MRREFLIILLYVVNAQINLCSVVFDDKKQVKFEVLEKSEFVLPKIIFRAQTKEEAFSFILYLSKKLSWFKQNGYTIPLPEHQAFKNLYVLGEATKDEEMLLKTVFYNEVYTFEDFTNGLQVISSIENIMSSVLERLYSLNQNWGFKLMPLYEIIVTLYGPGGNYNPDKGYVIMRVDKNGSFGRKPVLESVVHELVHIGIEENIVKKFKLTHWEKERLVDLICFTCFKDIVPNYWMQKIEDTSIDTFVTKAVIEKSLPEAIKKFIESKHKLTHRYHISKID